MIGDPIGKRLIEKKNLLSTAIVEDDSLLVEEEKKHERHTSMYPSAVFQLIIAIGIGTIVSLFPFYDRTDLSNLYRSDDRCSSDPECRRVFR